MLWTGNVPLIRQKIDTKFWRAKPLARECLKTENDVKE
jgi:hypothetical protein